MQIGYMLNVANPRNDRLSFKAAINLEFQTVNNTQKQMYQLAESKIRSRLNRNFSQFTNNFDLLEQDFYISYYLKDNFLYMNLTYKINEKIFFTDNNVIFPAGYFIWKVIKNHYILPQGFSLIHNTLSTNLLQYSKSSTQRNCVLIRKRNNAIISTQQWEDLFQLLSLKLKTIGQAYGIVNLKLSKKKNSIFCYLSEDYLDVAQQTMTTSHKPLKMREIVDLFVNLDSMEIEQQAQKCLPPDEELWSTVFEKIEVKKKQLNNNQIIELTLSFPKSIKPHMHAFLLNLQKKIEYVCHLRADPLLSLSALDNDTVVLDCKLGMHVDHKNFIGLLYQLPTDLDLLDMLRLISCTGDLEKLLKETYKNRGIKDAMGKRGLLECLNNYYSCVDKNLPRRLLVLQELILCMEYSGDEEKERIYYDYHVQEVVEIVDTYIHSAKTFGAYEISQEELATLKEQHLEFLIRTNHHSERAKRTFFDSAGFSLQDQYTHPKINALNFGANAETIMYLLSVIKDLKAAKSDENINTSHRKRSYKRSASTNDTGDSKRRKISDLRPFFAFSARNSPDADRSPKNSCNHNAIQP